MKTEKVEYLSPDAVPEWDRPKMARNALAAASRCASRPLRIWMDDKYIYFADKEATS